MEGGMQTLDGGAMNRRSGSSAPDAAHSISTITDDAALDGVAQATTSAAHGLSDLTPIVISGASVSAYNGSFIAQTASADNPATQFWLLDEFTNPIAYAGDSTGGTWALD